jgi:predicted MFS family arabinose efflux permease
MGFTPLQAGAILLPQSAAILLLAPNSARLVERFGTKVITGAGLCFVTLAVILMSRLTTQSTTLEIIGVATLLGVGMAHVMAPATESIMGSLPRAKAGVGSAVNDTTRQVGGAIGVALLGSLLSSRYITEFHSSMVATGTAPSAVGDASNNIQAAVEFGKLTPPPLGPQVVEAAKHAFMSGFRLATVVAALIELIAAIGVFAWLPARAPTEAEREALTEEVGAVEIATT